MRAPLESVESCNAIPAAPEEHAPPFLNERSRLVRAEQVKLLYANASVGLGVTVFIAAIMTVLQWTVISHAALVAWLAYMVTLTSGRFVLVHRYWRAAAAPLRDDHWGTWYIIGVALSGLGW